MTQLNYYSHLLLNSKYKFFINLFIILSIYSIYYNNTISYCMIEDSAGSHTTIFKTQLEEFIQNSKIIESQLTLIEEQRLIIEKQQILIEQQKIEIKQFQFDEQESIKEHENSNIIIRDLKSDISRLDNDIFKGGTLENPKGYKAAISNLKTKVIDLQAQLTLTENVLDSITITTKEKTI